ncbi:hypothetical protein GQ44DRAFT_754752 [Phaeosphaeriaceae sp. PMI808]|nr:hypothetical protein GQ44DRAFT_754752 [Phaeosphaeriaceae sp. PMI808]
MSSAVANTAAQSAQRHVRRPLSRIVPAIPHRLSRNISSARPITPEESNKGTVTQNGLGPQVVEDKPLEQQSLPVRAVDAPMTPDSRASVQDGSEKKTIILAVSPTKSADDHIEHICERPGETEPTLLSQAHGTIHETNGNTTSPSIPNNEPKPVVNGTHRKMTIPTQLPPPFYPSNKIDRQASPEDGSEPAPNPSHCSYLSGGTAAFNVGTSSPMTPATPHENFQDGHIQQSATLLRPPPGLTLSDTTPSFPPGHTHHSSDTGAQRPYSSYSMAQPDLIYENGPGHHTPSFLVNSTAYIDPYNGNLPSKTIPNGISSSLSQSPNKSQFGEAKFGSEHGDGQHALPYQNGLIAQEGFEESPFELAAYLSTQFGNPEFADYILQIRSPDSIHLSIPVHGIVVVRSPIIAEAVRRSIPAVHRSRDTRRMLDVLSSDPFVTREALEEAIKVLYGAPLLPAHNILYGVAPYVYDNDQLSSSNDARMRMRQILSYIAAGRVLQLPSMQARGVDIARSFLRWDTVGEVLQVALRLTSTSRSKKDGFEAEDPFTAAVLNYAIDFMAYTFPVDFKLYNLAPELQDVPRLPVILDSRPSTHNPRLSKIRFGDAPPEDDAQPNHASRILSSILLSLPLPLIDRLFNHRATANQIGWTGAVKVMRDVIAEREKRRQKAMRGDGRHIQDRATSNPLMNNIFIEEHVEQVDESPLHPSGYGLVAQRVTREA